MPKIVSLAISKKKGICKETVSSGRLIKDHGFENDAHAGDWHRQVSFLAAESIALAKNKGLTVDFGSFAENIATTGIDWTTVTVGTCFRLGKTARVEITQIGKECKNRCAIYYQAGDCIMPREGVFARVLEGGTVQVEDPIEMLAEA